MSYIINNNNILYYKRPIFRIKSRPYSATWLTVSKSDGEGRERDALVVFSGDFKERYSDIKLEGHSSLSEAPFKLDLQGKPRPAAALSAEAYINHVIEQQPFPTPAETFRELASSVDRFVAFDGSFATQTDMADFLACWVLSTYATCEFDVVGYIWPNAERGSGKTQCLNTITELAYLGLTTTSSSSFASIRDEAMLGATIGFDDCENIKKMDHNKRELLLAGNTKGASVALKVQGRREGDWETQYVNPFAPRAFTSIGLPDPVLESRTIMIPLVQSSDQARTRRKPKNHDDWTIRPSKLRDYAWLNVVCGLADIASAKREMGSEVDLTGRNFDIFQPILTMAYWLQNRHGVDRLFDSMLAVLDSYQRTKIENHLPSPDAILLQVAWDELAKKGKDSITVATSSLVTTFTDMCRKNDITDEEYLDIGTQRIGQMLGRLGFKKNNSHGSYRSWRITRSLIAEKAKAIGFVLKDIPEFDLPKPIGEITDGPWSNDSSVKAPW